MQVERETLAKAYHKMFCIRKGCEGDPDESDYDTADMTNEVLEQIPAEAVSL